MKGLKISPYKPNTHLNYQKLNSAANVHTAKQTYALT
jgi:hypothetical protein